MRRTLGFVALVLASLSAQVYAGIVYSETVDGDLSEFANLPSGTLTTLNFSAGTNTVSGRQTFSSPFDLDSFAFTIPSGSSLVTASLQTTLAGGATSSTWLFYSGSAVPGAGTSLGSVTNLSGFPTIPQGSGTFQLLAFQVPGPFAAGTVDYTFTFDVQAQNGIPEPGSMLLLGGGLAVMAWRFRRR
jgi:hypothetical protein